MASPIVLGNDAAPAAAPAPAAASSGQSSKQVQAANLLQQMLALLQQIDQQADERNTARKREEKNAGLQAPTSSAPAKAGKGDSGDSDPQVSGLLLAILAVMKFLQASNATIASTAKLGATIAQIQTRISDAQVACLNNDQAALKTYTDTHTSGDTSGNQQHDDNYSSQVTVLSTQFNKDSQAFQSDLTSIQASAEETNSTVQNGTNGQKTVVDLSQSVLQVLSTVSRLLA
jgi:hypothetical protein